MSTSESTGLPTGWEVKHSRTKGLPYYFNASTKESRWEPPADTDTDLLKKYMAEFHSSSTTTNPGASSSGAPTGSDPAGAAGSGSAAADPNKIQCWHLLVKHNESRRASSWRESNITRTKAEAREILRGYQDRIKAGESLSDIATSESDCSSARKGGDLGAFGRGEMQAEFEEAAFALKPGEVSDIVETASGLHLIERRP